MRFLSFLLMTLLLAASTNDQLVVRDGLHYEVVDGRIANTPFTGLLQTYYRNGKTRLEEAYKDGLPDGLSQSRYKSGQLWSELTYKNGKREGLSRHWHKR